MVLLRTAWIDHCWHVEADRCHGAELLIRERPRSSDLSIQPSLRNRNGCLWNTGDEKSFTDGRSSLGGTAVNIYWIRLFFFLFTLSCKLIYFLLLSVFLFFFFFPDACFFIYGFILSPFHPSLYLHSFFVFVFGVGQLEYIHLSAPFVAVKNKEVNLTVVLWPSQVGTVTYIWWFGNNSEVAQYFPFQLPCIKMQITLCGSKWDLG